MYIVAGEVRTRNDFTQSAVSAPSNAVVIRRSSGSACRCPAGRLSSRRPDRHATAVRPAAAWPWWEWDHPACPSLRVGRRSTMSVSIWSNRRCVHGRRVSQLVNAYYLLTYLLTYLLAVWLSGNALASINVVALRQTRLVLRWVTVCGRVNHLGM